MGRGQADRRDESGGAREGLALTRRASRAYPAGACIGGTTILDCALGGPRGWAIEIGTDHPIPWQDKSVDHILKAPGFSNAERRMMLGETAAKLLKIRP